MKGSTRKIFILKEELKRLYLIEKLSIKELSHRYNCTKNTISYWLRKYKIKTRTSSESMKLFGKKTETIGKQELYEVYNQKASLNEIAKKFNCSISTIINKLRKYNITNKFSNNKRIIISKKDLKKLYMGDKLNTYKIAEKYGTCQATIWKKLKKYKIKKRSSHELNSNIPSKKLLQELYIVNRLSTWEIEKKYGFSRSTIHRKLREYGMIRTRAETHRIYPRRDFSENENEKTYLIGFRLGDLRARKIWENSETIQVDCGSTKKEQISLIKKLFQNYGHVWISIPNSKGKIQIEAFLNQSFCFLLDKKIPKMLISKKENFFSFLAGFTDAEGTIGVSKKQAYFSIVNQNKNWLSYIRNNLINFGINCPKIGLGSEKGTAVTLYSDKLYFSNKDCWYLRLTKKSELYKLLENMEPYLKHEKKVKNLKLAKINILDRNRRFGE